MSFSDPWYLTIVRTQGIQYVRPEKSWRPIVSVTVVEHDRTYETILGCDGRNPNLRAPIELRECHGACRLDIKVWHKSQTKKSKRKRSLVGSAYVTLGELLRREDSPGANISLNLKCPPAQKRNPAIGGTRQLNCAALTLRLQAPSAGSSSSHTKHTSTFSSEAATLVSSPLNSDFEEDVYSDSALPHGSTPGSPTTLTAPWTPEPPSQSFPSEHQLRKRKKHKRRKLKAYCLDSDGQDEASEEEEEEYQASESSASDGPPTPQGHYFDHEPARIHREEEGSVFDDGSQEVTLEDILSITFTSSFDNDDGSWCAPHTVPQPMTRTETVLDSFSPYRELSHPRCDFGKVLGRLLTEWYAVGASLLATAALNAAVFGYSSGTLFDMNGLALRSVTVGSIASGIGLVTDAWFLMLYSSGDIDRFQRLAADVDTSFGYSYFYFSLTCRLPTFCLFISAFALMLFLLTVAWAAWPTAVLVMCCSAGMLLTLQYLIFGVRRTASFIAWLVWNCMHFRKRRQQPREKLSVPPLDVAPTPTPPPPYTSPPMPTARLANDDEENGRGEEKGKQSLELLPPSIGRREEL